MPIAPPLEIPVLPGFNPPHIDIASPLHESIDLTVPQQIEMSGRGRGYRRRQVEKEKVKACEEAGIQKVVCLCVAETCMLGLNGSLQKLSRKQKKNVAMSSLKEGVSKQL